LPPMIVALAILGAAGLVFQRPVFGWTGLLWGHVFLNFAIPLRLIGLSLADRNKAAELTALSLGLTRLQIFVKCTWREIRVSAGASWLLAFFYSSSSLFIVLVLGGSPRFTTLEVFLYEAVKLNLDWGKAIQIACLQICLGLLVFIIYLNLQSRKKIGFEKNPMLIFQPRTRGWSIGGALVIACILFGGVFLPLGVAVKEGLLHLRALENSDWVESFWASLGIAFCVGGTSLALLYPYMHRLYWDKSPRAQKIGSWLITFPQFVSSLLVALGLSVFFPGFREDSAWAIAGIIVTQTLFVIPLIYFPLQEGFLRMSHERAWVAQSLGASRWQRVRHVELPSLQRSVILSFLIAVSFSLGEVSSILLFAPQGVHPLSLSIFQAMSRYRFQEAHALTMILLLVISGVLVGISCLEKES